MIAARGLAALLVLTVALAACTSAEEQYLEETSRLCDALGEALPVRYGGETIEDATRLSRLQTNAIEQFSRWDRSAKPDARRLQHEAIRDQLFPRKDSIEAAASLCRDYQAALYLDASTTALEPSTSVQAAASVQASDLGPPDGFETAYCALAEEFFVDYRDAFGRIGPLMEGRNDPAEFGAAKVAVGDARRIGQHLLTGISRVPRWQPAEDSLNQLSKALHLSDAALGGFVAAVDAGQVGAMQPATDTGARAAEEVGLFVTKHELLVREYSLCWGR